MTDTRLIWFNCPYCAAALKSVNGLQLGRTVGCPKCRATFVVSAPPPRPAPAARAEQDPGPKVRRRRTREDRSDEDEAKEPAPVRRPRKRPARRKAPVPGLLIAGLVGGLVLFLTFCLVGLVILAHKGQPAQPGVGPLTAAPATRAAVVGDGQGILGYWRATALVVTGQAPAEDFTSKVTMQFREDGKMIGYTPTGGQTETRYRLDPGGTLKQIDLTEMESTFTEADGVSTEEMQEKSLPGIYSLEGDRLTICYRGKSDAAGSSDRPTTFNSPPDSGIILITLQRDRRGPPAWQEITSAEGRYRVMLPPGEVRPNASPSGRVGGQSVKRPEGTYSVVYSDLKPGELTSAADFLHEHAREEKKRLLSEKDVTVGGARGKEYILEDKRFHDEGVDCGRVFVVGGRVYFVQLLGTRKRLYHPDVRKLLDSFRPTN